VEDLDEEFPGHADKGDPCSSAALCGGEVRSVRLVVAGDVSGLAKDMAHRARTSLRYVAVVDGPVRVAHRGDEPSPGRKLPSRREP
jgi:hypothetical protein